MSYSVPLWISHQINIRTFVLRGNVVLKEPLRIGAGRGEGLSSITDLPIIRISFYDQKVPFIPGSSWKGVFRSHVESLLRSLGKSVCEGTPRNSCADRRGLRNNINSLTRNPTEEDRRRLVEVLWNGLCLCCKMFGSLVYKSNVIFADSFPVVDKGTPKFSIGVKPGIAIDRRSGAARRGALYKVEFVEPGSMFNFEIRARNLPNYLLGLIAWSVMDLKSGNLRVGGFKSRGFGQVDLTNLQFEVVGGNYVKTRDGRSVLQGFIDNSKPWYDPLDENVEFTGVDDLLAALKDLSVRKLKES